MGNATITNSSGNLVHVYQDVRKKHVVASLETNAMALFAMLVLFEVLMRCRCTARYLAPRLDPEDAWKRSWLFLAWRHGGDLYEANLDGAVMVRFCVLGFKFCCTGTLVAAFLIPFYRTGHGGAKGFDVMNISNLSDRGHETLWLVVVAAYILVAAFGRGAVEEWNKFLHMRSQHYRRIAQARCLASSKGPCWGAAQALHSVVVECIPDSARRADGAGVEDFFANIFPERGARSVILQPSNLQTFTEYLESQESSSSSDSSDAERSKQEVPREGEESEDLQRGSCFHALLCPGRETLGKRQRSVKHIALKRSKRFLHAASHSAWFGSSTALVTFHSVSDRVIAEQVLLHHPHNDWGTHEWVVRSAPEAHGIHWPNVAVPWEIVRKHRGLSNFCIVIGLICWTVPVSFIQLWANLDNMRHLEPVDKFCRALYRFVPPSLMRDYLPLYALMGLQMLVPYVLQWIAIHISRIKEKSRVQRWTLRANIIFQVATLYVTVLSGSVYNTLREVVDKPMSVLPTLSEQIPTVAVYFMTYVMARAGVSAPCLLLYPALSRLTSCCKQEQEVPLVYPIVAMEGATLVLVMMLGLTYSVIAPLIMPLCAVYFGLSYLVYRWLYLYVYTTEFESHGNYWPELFNGSMVGLELGVLTLASVISVKMPQMYWSYEFMAVLVLFVLSISLHIFLRHHFVTPGRRLSLWQARELDSMMDQAMLEQFTPEYYLDPRAKTIREVWSSRSSYSNTTSDGESAK